MEAYGLPSVNYQSTRDMQTYYPTIYYFFFASLDVVIVVAQQKINNKNHLKVPQTSTRQLLMLLI